MRSVKKKESTSSGSSQQTDERFDLFRAVVQELRVDDVLRVVMDKIQESLGQSVGIKIQLIHPESGHLVMKAFRGFSSPVNVANLPQNDNGLAESIVKSGMPEFRTLSGESDSGNKAAVRDDFRSWAGFPLVCKKQLFGVLGIFTRDADGLNPEMREKWAMIGEAVGVALQNALYYEQAAVRAKRLVTISRAITVSRQLGTLNEVLQDITKVLVQSLGFDQSWIGLVDDSNSQLQGKAGFGAGMRLHDIGIVFDLRMKKENPVAQSLSEQKPAFHAYRDDTKDPIFQTWLKNLGAAGCCCIPILSADMPLGVIGVFYASDPPPGEEDVKTLISVAEQAAIAVENARLYERMKTSEERYRTLFESAGTSLVILDEEERFRLVNHAFESLSGYSRQRLIEHMAFSKFLVEKEDPKKESRVLDGFPELSNEKLFVGKDGLVKHVFITETKIPGSKHKLLSLIDMTKERELERRLFRSEELAVLGELSAGIAHEIRNPLVAITSSIRLLKDEPALSPDGQQWLDVLKEEADHLAAIVEDFLKYARPKKPAFQNEDINQLIKEVVKRHRELNENSVMWVEQYDPGLPLVSIDRHQIQQVITNLFLNSLEAMNEGGILAVKTEKSLK